MTYEEKRDRYSELVAQCDRFERKGKTMPYTSANGHMFSLLNKAGEVGFRYSKEVQKQYIEQFDTTLFKSYNAVMHGYVLIPESVLEDQDKAVALLNEAYEYVMSLDPK